MNNSIKTCHFCANKITNGQYQLFECFPNRVLTNGVIHYIHNACLGPNKYCPLCHCQKCHERGLWHLETLQSPRYLLQCPTCHVRYHRRCCKVNCMDCGSLIPQAATSSNRWFGWPLNKIKESNNTGQFDLRNLKRDSLGELNSDMILTACKDMTPLNKSDLTTHDILVTLQIPWFALVGKLNFNKNDIKRWWNAESLVAAGVTWQKLKDDLHLTMADIVNLQPQITDLSSLNMKEADLRALYFSFGHLMKLPNWMMPDLIIDIGFHLDSFTPQLNKKQVEILMETRGLTSELAKFKTHTS